MTMYEKILELCNEKGIKPAQLSKDAGVPKSTISELKQGRTKTLSTQTLSKIANYFGVSLGYFDINDEVDDIKDELFELFEETPPTYMVLPTLQMEMPEELNRIISERYQAVSSNKKYTLYRQQSSD